MIEEEWKLEKSEYCREDDEVDLNVYATQFQ